MDWIGLLKGASKFRLDDLVTAIENYRITQQEKWIQQNIFTLYKCALSTDSLIGLLDYCHQIMVSQPDIILKSNDIRNLPKEILITLLKNDELNIDEGELWLSVVQWGIEQVPGLINNPKSWSYNEFTIVKSIISDCIPQIRFFNISNKDFNEKVVPYEDLIPRELWHDMLYYHLKEDYKPTTPILTPRIKQGHKIDSTIIDKPII